MNQADFNKLVEDTIAATAQLLVVKGGEYAGSDDRLGNFKRGAELTGCTPLQVAFVYMSKRYDAVATAIRDQATGNERPRSEPIGGRLDDLINYCLLVKALFAEAEGIPLKLRCQCKPLDRRLKPLGNDVECNTCGRYFGPQVLTADRA